MKTLGYWDLVERLPPELQSKLTVYGPQFSLRVEAGDGMTGHEEVVKAARKAGEEAMLIGEPWDSVKLMEAIEIMLRLRTVFRPYGPEKLAKMPAKYVEPIERLKKAHTPEAIPQLMMGLSIMVRGCLHQYSRYTKTMFWSEAALNMMGTTMNFTLRIHGAKPESRKVDLKGYMRTAWRCGCWTENGSSFEGLSWAEKDLPGANGDEERMLPLYVQHHTLHHLCERMDFTTDEAIGKGHFWLGRSLQDPVILPPVEGRYLVEFKYAGKTAGYFVAKKADDCIVITTFLFLTMMGTPQAKKLREHLGIERETIDYLELERLKTFRDPDIQNDKELMDIFTECDCHHLFEIAKIDPHEVDSMPGHAQLCRKIFFPQEFMDGKPWKEDDAPHIKMLEAMLYREKG